MKGVNRNRGKVHTIYAANLELIKISAPLLSRLKKTDWPHLMHFLTAAEKTAAGDFQLTIFLLLRPRPQTRPKLFHLPVRLKKSLRGLPNMTSEYARDKRTPSFTSLPAPSRYTLTQLFSVSTLYLRRSQTRWHESSRDDVGKCVLSDEMTQLWPNQRETFSN